MDVRVVTIDNDNGDKLELCSVCEAYRRGVFADGMGLASKADAPRGPQPLRCPYCRKAITAAAWASHQMKCFDKWMYDNRGKKPTTDPPASN